MSDLQIDTQVNSILDALDSPAGETPAGDDAAKALAILDAGDSVDGQDGGETPSDTDTGTVEAAESKDDQTPIEPPVSWKAEEKERFKALPPDMQKYLSDRESEREKGLSKSQQESADAKKAAEAERAAVQEERRVMAERLATQIEVLRQMDPVLAEGQKTDWAKLAQEDPVGYVQQRAAYDQRVTHLNALATERQNVQQRMTHDQLRQAHENLARELDFWNDTDKRTAFQSDMKKYLASAGYRPEEINGVTDARAILTARKAMLYDQLMEQQSKIAAQKRPGQPGKVLRTQSTETGTTNARAEALKRTANKTGRTDDQVAAILAAL